jgi:hypothetical protein
VGEGVAARDARVTAREQTQALERERVRRRLAGRRVARDGDEDVAVVHRLDRVFPAGRQLVRRLGAVVRREPEIGHLEDDAPRARRIAEQHPPVPALRNCDGDGVSAQATSRRFRGLHRERVQDAESLRDQPLGCPSAGEQVGAEHPSVVDEVDASTGAVEALERGWGTKPQRFLGETLRARPRTCLVAGLPLDHDQRDVRR